MTNTRKKIKRQFAGYALKKRKFMMFYFMYAHFPTGLCRYIKSFRLLQEEIGQMTE